MNPYPILKSSNQNQQQASSNYGPLTGTTFGCGPDQVAKQTIRATQIEEVVTGLAIAIETLEKEVDSLAARLEPISVIKDKAKGDGSIKPEPVWCPLAQKLKDLSLRLRDLTGFVVLTRTCLEI